MISVESYFPAESETTNDTGLTGITTCLLNVRKKLIIEVLNYRRGVQSAFACTLDALGFSLEQVHNSVITLFRQWSGGSVCRANDVALALFLNEHFSELFDTKLIEALEEQLTTLKEVIITYDSTGCTQEDCGYVQHDSLWESQDDCVKLFSVNENTSTLVYTPNYLEQYDRFDTRRLQGSTAFLKEQIDAISERIKRERIKSKNVLGRMLSVRDVNRIVVDSIVAIIIDNEIGTVDELQSYFKEVYHV